MVIYLERGANDLHMAQLMPMPHIISRFIKMQIGLAFLVSDYPSCRGRVAAKRVLNGFMSLFEEGNGVGELLGSPVVNEEMMMTVDDFVL